MKDQTGKELKRPFAKDKRPSTEDMYKIRVVPTEPKYDVIQEDGRIKVTKKQKDIKQELIQEIVDAPIIDLTEEVT